MPPPHPLLLTLVDEVEDVQEVGTGAVVVAGHGQPVVGEGQERGSGGQCEEEGQLQRLLHVRVYLPHGDGIVCGRREGGRHVVTCMYRIMWYDCCACMRPIKLYI